VFVAAIVSAAVS